MWMTLRVSRLRLAVAAAAVGTAIVGTTASGGAQELVLALVLLAGFAAESRDWRGQAALTARSQPPFAPFK